MSKVFDFVREDPVLNYDLIFTILGKEIGEGASRKVFQHAQDDSLVVKLATTSYGVQDNCNEAQMWDKIKWLEKDSAWVKDWFAPVVYVSPNCNVLIMKKTTDIPSKKKPIEVPSFLSDVCTRNFGWLGNKYVAHDYGFISGFIQYKKKFRKVEW